MAGCFALVLSLFVVVFAQGYGLRGPLGSMVKAINGMVEEQERVVAAFVMAMVGLNVTLIGVYFIMMFQLGAIISSAVMILGLMYQYHCAVRIINRFAYTAPESQWSPNAVAEDVLHDDDEPGTVVTTLNSSLLSNASEPSKLSKKNQISFNPFSSSSTGNASYEKAEGESPPQDFYIAMDDNNDDNKSVRSARTTATTFNPVLSAGTSTSSPASTPTTSAGSGGGAGVSLHCGYISMKVDGRFSGYSYLRRYIVVRGRLLFCYKSQEDWDKRPNEPLLRPISLAGYSVQTEIAQNSFGLILLPHEEDEDGRSWQFRCDTMDEMDIWKQAFQRALKHA